MLTATSPSGRVGARFCVLRRVLWNLLSLPRWRPYNRGRPHFTEPYSQGQACQDCGSPIFGDGLRPDRAAQHFLTHSDGLNNLHICINNTI